MLLLQYLPRATTSTGKKCRQPEHTGIKAAKNQIKAYSMTYPSNNSQRIGDKLQYRKRLQDVKCQSKTKCFSLQFKKKEKWHL